MIETLVEFDKQLFLFLNSFHNEFWDSVLWYVSKTSPWLPLYLSIVLWLFLSNNYQKASIALLLVIPLMFATDSGSVHLFKEVFERLRPCHDLDLSDVIHNVRRCGGRFGFISSHAANTFGIAVFFLNLFHNKKWTTALLVWATLVSYSRIYLGVHFPADIFAGAVWGALWGWIIFKLYLTITRRMESVLSR